MDYSHITEFLGKFKKILFSGEEANRIIADIITKHIASPIQRTAIKTKGTVVHINGSPMLRNEILVHKQGILRDMENLLPERHFTDIR
jgi:hypothetical protein